ncbi:riboflavin biosynthesis pyrimidine reductase [Stackebrandtia endophytica]|uniref:Riboflavin biosynthesis pyrimidine reductase n=1 Tax=Stackebrandtia endophytica TaxID=1496996 RepID=A0A543B349_9ACTN|nr:pyrimidine reductase family protein [Stackebrandtia endophytica]TQL79261.1 riboflavin biosynthesis pyrimidine reductase [Stackebrandtia endophytica]
MELILPVPETASGELDDATLIEHYAPPPEATRWLRVNFVSSADGAVEVDGNSHALSSEDDMRAFRFIRMRCDVLITGAGTVRTDGYQALRMSPERVEWRRAHGLPDHPVMAVVTRSADLDLSMPLFTQAPQRPIVITCERAPVERRLAAEEVADVLVAGDDGVDFATALDLLEERGLRQQLCEGGPHILGELTAADLVDELCLTLSPVLAGAGSGRITDGPSSPLRRMRLAQALHANGNLLLRYIRLR